MASKKKTALVEGDREGRDIMFDKLSFAAAEAYKLLRTNLQFSMPEKPCRILGVTSAIRGEGKSTTAANLSYVIAESGKRVLLIDADMRLPTAHTKIGVKRSPGLSNLLAGLTHEKSAMQVSPFYENWYVLASGDIPPNPSELLGSQRMESLLKSLSEIFDYIILDLPPVNIVADALVISPWIDGLVVVVRQNHTSRRALNECMYQMQKIGAKFLGFVMSDVSMDKSGYGKYSKYGKYGKYGKYKKYGYGYGYDYGYGYANADESTKGKKRDAFIKATGASNAPKEQPGDHQDNT